MDEELIGQRRDISGERIQTCELCGRPTDEPAIAVLERRSPLESAEGLWICPECHRRMDAAELPVEIEQDPENLMPDDV